MTGRPCASASAIGHAVAFEMRGQHEQVGAAHRAPQAGPARPLQGSDPVVSPRRATAASRRAVAPGSRSRSPAMVRRHGKSASRARASTSRSKPLRGTIAPTDSSSTSGPPLPAESGTRSVPGRITVDARRRNAETRNEKIGRRPAGGDDQTRCRKGSSFTVLELLHPRRHQSCLAGQRMMDQCNDRLTGMQRRRHLRQNTERQPIDHDRTIRGDRQQARLRDGNLLGTRRRKPVPERQQIDVPAEPAQFRDDAAIVGVATGRRCRCHPAPRR